MSDASIIGIASGVGVALEGTPQLQKVNFIRYQLVEVPSPTLEPM